MVPDFNLEKEPLKLNKDGFLEHGLVLVVSLTDMKLKLVQQILEESSIIMAIHEN